MNAPWITYRPELKVLDCTVRDGGLCNNHQFTDEFVKAIYDANVAAGIDWMELGYKASKKQFPKSEFGPWKHCDEDKISVAMGSLNAPTGAQLARHIFTADKGDYYQIADDIPQRKTS